MSDTEIRALLAANAGFVPPQVPKGHLSVRVDRIPEEHRADVLAYVERWGGYALTIESPKSPSRGRPSGRPAVRDDDVYVVPAPAMREAE